MAKSPRHVHDMLPSAAAGILKCRSCRFMCTERALPLVKAMPHKHTRVKATDPQARIPWDGEVAGR